MYNLETVKSNKLIGNNRIGSVSCLPLEDTIDGKPPIENEIWSTLMEKPHKWHYFNIELNLNKYNDKVL